MRHVVGSLGVLVALAASTGCSAPPRPKTQSAHDVFGAMERELSHTVAKNADVFGVMDKELSHAIGTTTLSNATLLTDLSATSILLTSMPLPESRMSLAEYEPALQTWGATTQRDLNEVPDTRE